MCAIKKYNKLKWRDIFYVKTNFSRSGWGAGRIGGALLAINGLNGPDFAFGQKIPFNVVTIGAGNRQAAP